MPLENDINDYIIDSDSLIPVVDKSVTGTSENILILKGVVRTCLSYIKLLTSDNNILKENILLINKNIHKEFYARTHYMSGFEDETEEKCCMINNPGETPPKHNFWCNNNKIESILEKKYTFNEKEINDILSRIE